MPRHIPHEDKDKGHVIRVVGGSYKGRKGWLHKGMEETDEMIYVILAATSSKPEVAKQIRKTSIEFGAKPEPKIWEEAFLNHKKVEPAYNAFLNKVVEGEFKPTPQLMAIIWHDLNLKYEARQGQARSSGYIRVKVPKGLKHPDKRGEETDKTFGAVFKEFVYDLKNRMGV
jgi:hypothetical protein